MLPSSNQGLYLFTVTSLLSIMIGKLIHQQQCRLLSLHKSYEQTLKKMFPIDMDKKKLPSRHTETTAEIFQQRKAYFLSLYASLLGSKPAPKVIHVAGTKGKGSTVEYIAAALRSQGYKTGVFTSPHIHTARERVKIGQELISKESFVRLGNEAIEQLGDKSWIVFFDLLLYVAMKHFCEEGVDYIVLETGVGGRYDSTNFLEDPVATVITSISIDHQAILGNTIEEIAWQKAGIIKEKSNVFTTSCQLPSVLQVFRKECMEKNATLHVISPDVSSLTSLNIKVDYDVQVQNACTSIAVLRSLGIPIDGMKNFFWPCRMERFQIQNSILILDGCHNGDSVKRFLEAMHRNYSGYDILVIFGAGIEKCLDDMLIEVMTLSDSIVITQSKHFRAMSEKQLYDAIITYGTHTNKMMMTTAMDSGDKSLIPFDRLVNGTVDQRLEWAIKYANSKNRGEKKVVIAVCGSLFVAAEAREFLFRIEPSLFGENDWVRQRDE